jgi:hypothetical protein
LSWNLNRGLEYPKILEFLRTTQADLLLLQEVDLNARRTRYRDIASELAHHLNLNYVFGLEFQELSQGTPGRPAYHGMATLSPWPLSKARTIRFRDQSSFWKPRWYVPNLPAFQRRTGGRSVLVAEATVCKRKVVTYNLHLESRGPDDLRVRQLNEVLADCRKYVDRPNFVVAGDGPLRRLEAEMIARGGSQEQWEMADRLCSALARQGSVRAIRAVATHAYNRAPALGDALARFEQLSRLDLSVDPEQLAVLMKAIRDLAPSRVLGFVAKRENHELSCLMQAVAGTPTLEVRAALETIAEKFKKHRLGEQADRILAKLEPALLGLPLRVKLRATTPRPSTGASLAHPWFSSTRHDSTLANSAASSFVAMM